MPFNLAKLGHPSSVEPVKRSKQDNDMQIDGQS